MNKLAAFLLTTLLATLTLLALAEAVTCEAEEAGVPVLWRPLHESSGGWFWWGAKGAEPFRQLWIYLYNELTCTYGCNNLIWNARWLWFNTWGGDYVYSKAKYSEKYTEAELLKKVYDSEYVITLDELPDLD